MLKNWSGIRIKHALEIAGFSQSDIARERDVSVSWVNQIINKGEKADHVQRCIAEKIGVDVKVIWPEYYLRDSVAA